MGVKVIIESYEDRWHFNDSLVLTMMKYGFQSGIYPSLNKYSSHSEANNHIIKEFNGVIHKDWVLYRSVAIE